MNGANAEPCAKIKMSPRSAINSTKGRSHHFLRTRRKLQSSEKIESLLMGGSVRMRRSLCQYCVALLSAVLSS